MHVLRWRPRTNLIVKKYLLAPWFGSMWAACLSANKGHSQIFTNQDKANVLPIGFERP
jgi:hypothetical protein